MHFMCRACVQQEKVEDNVPMSEKRIDAAENSQVGSLLL